MFSVLEFVESQFLKIPFSQTVFTRRGLEKTPTAVLPPAAAYHMPKRGTTDWSQVSAGEQEKFDQVMEKMRQKTNNRRILTKPCFQDFDK